MNRFTAPCACDRAHHRNRFEPSVRAALALLDRVSEGIPVPARDIRLALLVTGDAVAFPAQTDFRDIRALRVFARDHECANAREVS